MTAKKILLVLLAYAGTALAGDAALVMSLEGKVGRSARDGLQPVEAFVKLKQGDRLVLEKDARLQLVYFESGRQETWGGGGRIEVATAESKAAAGLEPSQVRQLPAVMVKQLARTPALDSQGRAGALRLRSMPTPSGIAKIEETYRKLRAEADKDDLGPEMYLLSGMFEMRELERIENILADLQREQGGNPQTAALASLYTRALRDARAAAK